MSKQSAGSREVPAEQSNDAPSDLTHETPNLLASKYTRRSEQAGSPANQIHAVVVATSDGLITDVLQARDTDANSGTKPSAGNAVDDVWPGEPAGRLSAGIQRAIRSRQVESAELKTDDGDACYEFIFIPYGRGRAVIVARDVSEHRSAFSRMKELAYFDDSTKLPNKQFLLEELDHCTTMLRLKEGRAALICIDVQLKDGQDHAWESRQRDAVFVELAARLTHELRGANALDDDDYERYSVVTRIGPTQFGIVLPVIDNGEDAEGVTSRVLDSLQQPVTIGNRESKVAAKAGIALFPQDGSDADTLYQNAVAALEDACNYQSTPYKFHSGTVQLRTIQRQDLELELRSALDSDEFSIEYLPIADSKTGQTISVEALLRWPQSIFGPKSIQKVISIAENTGLILPIGDWVLRKSCEELKAWHANGLSDLRLSVNLSAQEFSREDLSTRISAVLSELKIEPHFLDIEITEYSLFRDAMKNYPMCTRLDNLGVGLVIDDFGTGACSLAHVARSPVSTVKIDNCFVVNAPHDADDRAACAAITAMAHHLGMRVIAEGVETREQAEILTEQGCDALQGYLVSKPTSAAGVAELASRKPGQ